MYNLIYQQPTWGILLLLSILLMFFYWKLFQHKKHIHHLFAETFSIIPSYTSPILFLQRTCCIIFTWILLTQSLMQPSIPLEKSVHSIRKTPIYNEIAIFIDNSQSMATEDTSTKISRFNRAKEIIELLVDQLGGVPISLYTFAGNVSMQCPATYDYLSFLFTLQALIVNDTETPGTDFTHLATNIHTLFAKKQKTAFFILSDGEDTTHINITAEEETKLAKTLCQAVPDMHSSFHTIGLGTKSGALIPHITQDGHSVTSRLHTHFLQAIAEYGRGTCYLESQLSLIQLIDALYANTKETPFVTSSKKSVCDFSQFFVYGAMVFLTIGLILPQTRYRSKKLFLWCVICCMPTLSADTQEASDTKSTEKEINSAVEYAFSGQTEHAYAILRELRTRSLTSDERDTINYNLATLFLINKRYDKAIETLQFIPFHPQKRPLFSTCCMQNLVIAHLLAFETTDIPEQLNHLVEAKQTLEQLHTLTNSTIYQNLKERLDYLLLIANKKKRQHREPSQEEIRVTMMCDLSPFIDEMIQLIDANIYAPQILQSEKEAIKYFFDKNIKLLFSEKIPNTVQKTQQEIDRANTLIDLLQQTLFLRFQLSLPLHQDLHAVRAAISGLYEATVLSAFLSKKQTDMRRQYIKKLDYMKPLQQEIDTLSPKQLMQYIDAYTTPMTTLLQQLIKGKPSTKQTKKALLRQLQNIGTQEATRAASIIKLHNLDQKTLLQAFSAYDLPASIQWQLQRIAQQGLTDEFLTSLIQTMQENMTNSFSHECAQLLTSLSSQEKTPLIHTVYSLTFHWIEVFSYEKKSIQKPQLLDLLLRCLEDSISVCRQLIDAIHIHYQDNNARNELAMKALLLSEKQLYTYLEKFASQDARMHEALLPLMNRYKELFHSRAKAFMNEKNIEQHMQLLDITHKMLQSMKEDIEYKEQKPDNEKMYTQQTDPNTSIQVLQKMHAADVETKKLEYPSNKVLRPW